MEEENNNNFEVISSKTSNANFKQNKQNKQNSFGKTVLIPFASGIVGCSLVLGTCFGIPSIKEKLVGKQYECELRSKGYKYICGIDEAGRGPLAGPVVVASVIMPENSMIEGVNDSKKVSEKKREKLYDLILSEAISYGVGIIGQDEIDEINILNAKKRINYIFARIN